MIFEIMAAVGGAAAVTGWVFAYRSSRRTEDARGSLVEAELKTVAAERKLISADIIAASAQKKVGELEKKITRLEAQVSGSQLLVLELYGKLAKAGLPVGPVLVDHGMDILYPDQDRGETGASTGSGGGGGAPEVPGNDAGVAAETESNDR